MSELKQEITEGDVNQAHLFKLEYLPLGWSETTVAKVVKSISTNQKKIAQKKYLEQGEFPVIDQGQSFIGGYIDNKNLLIEGEPPFIVFGDHSRIFKFVDFQFVPGADGVKVLQPIGVIPKWCFYILQAIKLPNKGYARHYQYLKEAYLPVPPLAQQKQIVAKIEELFSHIEAGIEGLKKSKALLKQYRQSVLKSAVTGELTKDWREANKDKIEPASQLLQRILKQRRQHWEEQQLKQFQAKGKLPTNNKWKEKYKEPQKQEVIDAKVFCPNSWLQIGIESIAMDIVDCLHSTAKFIENGFYCIDTNSMSDSEILFDKARFVSEETFYDRIRRLKPQQGDILFSREGTIGKTAIVPENVELCLGQRMMMFRFIKEVSPEFIKLFLLSPVFKKQWKEKISGTTSPHVNISDIRKMLILIPTSEEQKKL